jgi:hypothetical protein
VTSQAQLRPATIDHSGLASIVDPDRFRTTDVRFSALNA